MIAKQSTVNNRLIEFQLESHYASTKPLLTDRHKRERLKWCKHRQDWGYEKWANVIFSDESNFMIVNRKTTPRVWRYKNEKYQTRMVKKSIQAGGGSVGIWGCISLKGTGCSATYSGYITAERYIPMLEDQLLPSIDLLAPNDNDWYFQQDGASCHRANKVKEWFRSNKIRTLTWPALSPDLNPIEHVWQEIDKKLANDPPHNLAQLENALTKAWNEIEVSFIEKIIESMPERVKACIDAHGGHSRF